MKRESNETQGVGSAMLTGNNKISITFIGSSQIITTLYSKHALINFLITKKFRPLLGIINFVLLSRQLFLEYNL